MLYPSVFTCETAASIVDFAQPRRIAAHALVSPAADSKKKPGVLV